MIKTLSTFLLILTCNLAFADVSNLISEAEKLHAEAREMRNAWVPTGRFIAEAKLALEMGNVPEANNAVERALMLARASIEQALAERKNWQTRQLVR